MKKEAKLSTMHETVNMKHTWKFAAIHKKISEKNIYKLEIDSEKSV